MTVTIGSAVRNRWTLAAVALLAVGIGAAALACGESPKLVQDAIGEDPAAAKAAIAALRAQGPAGLRRLMRVQARSVTILMLSAMPGCTKCSMPE